jgi:hypothetical protein
MIFEWDGKTYRNIFPDAGAYRLEDMNGNGELDFINDSQYAYGDLEYVYYTWDKTQKKFIGSQKRKDQATPLPCNQPASRSIAN